MEQELSFGPLLDNENTTSQDKVEDLPDLHLDIENVEIGILLKQKGENEIKVSLRSKSYADVSKIAATFGGGGHIRAAGCTIKDTIENEKKKLVEEALKEI